MSTPPLRDHGEAVAKTPATVVGTGRLVADVRTGFSPGRVPYDAVRELPLDLGSGFTYGLTCDDALAFVPGDIIGPQESALGPETRRQMPS